MKLVQFDPNHCIDCDGPLYPSEKESGICLCCWGERRTAERAAEAEDAATATVPEEETR